MTSIFVKIIEDIAIFLVIIILVAITAGYAASAAAKITDIPNWKDNPKLASAHKYLSWAASVGWIYIGLVVLVIILLIIFALTGLVDFGISDIVLLSILPIIITITNLLTVGVLLTTGILSAIGTADINRANVSDDQGSFGKALTATIISIGSLGLVVLFIVGSFVLKQRKKKKAAEEAQKEQVQSEARIIEQVAALKATQ